MRVDRREAYRLQFVLLLDLPYFLRVQLPSLPVLRDLYV